MKQTHKEAYPHAQVIIGFGGLGSIIGGIVAQLVILCVSGEADFAQIGFQPLLYVGLFSLIPSLLIGGGVALKQLYNTGYKSLLSTFCIGFMVFTLYIGAIVIYLGIQSILEVGVLLAFMMITGLFGGINSVIASVMTLPKSSKSHFDNNLKKDHDKYQRYTLNNH